MRKIILVCIFYTLLTTSAKSQYSTVFFDYESSSFDKGKALPAESYFIIQGQASNFISMVEVRIYNENGYPEKKPLYEKSWKRSFNNSSQTYAVPINYSLRGNEEYDITIAYFRKAQPSEIANFKKELFSVLDAYIDQNLELGKKKIDLRKSKKTMLADMNEIVSSAMTYYRSGIGREFDGFSDLVGDAIDRIDNNRQSEFLGEDTSEEENMALKQDLINALKKLAHTEVDFLLNSELLVLADIMHIDNYLTERTRTVLTLHGGFGGVYFEKDQKEDFFGRGFTAGITLPLGKKEFASPFWSNTSLMAGVYFNNFTLNNNAVATGPLLQRPYYLGIGYSFYQFLRISAGATLLENNGEIPGVMVNNEIYIRPYILLTADINLWIGLAK